MLAYNMIRKCETNMAKTELMCPWSNDVLDLWRRHRDDAGIELKLNAATFPLSIQRFVHHHLPSTCHLPMNARIDAEALVKTCSSRQSHWQILHADSFFDA